MQKKEKICNTFFKGDWSSTVAKLVNILCYRGLLSRMFTKRIVEYVRSPRSTVQSEKAAVRRTMQYTMIISNVLPTDSDIILSLRITVSFLDMLFYTCEHHEV